MSKSDNRSNLKSAMPAQPLIVGIGASAGGLEAFATFLSNVSTGNGMAFVLIQHLDPQHRSMLVELLSTHTDMPVAVAEDGAELLADHVFVIPPDSTLTIVDGYLHVDSPAPPRAQRRPIDTFFESLATDQGENAVCVILSGTGTDGTRGMEAIKTYGGLALAQAESDHTPMSGMPRNAAATGRVDHVLPVAEMPARLIEYRRHMQTVAQCKNDNGERQDAAAHLDEISKFLRARTGHDFSEYKDNTRIRRVQRRMQVLSMDTVKAYIERLKSDPTERDALFHELLIGVTAFFRDSESWDALKADVVVPLLAGKGADDSLRVWVAGCGTGEEAYSVALVLKEALAEHDMAPELQVFGTDLNDDAISVARAGWYADPVPGMPRAYLERWFTAQQGGYAPIKTLRDACIFSPHDLGRDPPFSKLDLVVCRNLLIYMKGELQDRILRKLHYSLRTGGYLFLGQSENIARSSQLFATLDTKHRLFQRREALLPMPVDLSTPTPPHQAPEEAAPAGHRGGGDPIDQDVRRIMEPYAPAYLVVDRQYMIQRFSGGSAGRYLEPPGGAASLNVFDLVKKALRPSIRKGLQTAFSNQQSMIKEDLALRIDGRNRAITLIVEPLGANQGHSELCVVAFRDAGPVLGESPPKTDDAAPRAAEPTALAQELHVTQTQLRSATTELERAQEETRAVTEEYQSVNEELQASNEELETSKEEMQSINEELQTVNAELNNKNERLTSVNSDLRNLLESTQIATIFLDNELRIKNFTPGVAELFHLRDTDYGRPITELASRLDYAELQQDVETVLRKLTVVEREVSLENGKTFIMHIRLYRAVTNVIDGVVITFFDITERQRYESQRAWLAAIVNSSQDAIISQDLDARITSWNAAAERIFAKPAQKAIGRTLTDLLGPELDEPSWQAIVNRERSIDRPWQAQIRLQRERGPTDLALTVSPVLDTSNTVIATSIIVRNVSERVAQEDHRELLLQELNHRVKNVLATVQSIMMQTLDQAPTSFRHTFTRRIQALAQTHNLLTYSKWQGVALRELLETELRPYGEQENPRWHLSGAAITLGTSKTIALAMALHELTTNAAKYGALATDEGRLIVHWDITDEDGARALDLTWLEQDGPPVQAPSQSGFGLRLVQEGLAHELDARVQLDFQPQGVRVTIRLPLENEGRPE